MRVVFTGPVAIALVNTADSSAGGQAAVADTDPAMAEKVAFVRCASCWESMGDRPREHGVPACRAAVDVAENASWTEVAWEATDPYVVAEQLTATQAASFFSSPMAVPLFLSPVSLPCFGGTPYGLVPP
ncbi:hypothetical protein [Streptosporangium sp. LJ11]|uniref:hypothetical protein n=1 Tax=Streptosporangium sp. LJ11 TaxID=3436927 RepID=UPI003F791262